MKQRTSRADRYRFEEEEEEDEEEEEEEEEEEGEGEEEEEEGREGAGAGEEGEEQEQEQEQEEQEEVEDELYDEDRPQRTSRPTFNHRARHTHTGSVHPRAFSAEHQRTRSYPFGAPLPKRSRRRSTTPSSDIQAQFEVEPDEGVQFESVPFEDVRSDPNNAGPSGMPRSPSPSTRNHNSPPTHRMDREPPGLPSRRRDVPPDIPVSSQATLVATQVRGISRLPDVGKGTEAPPVQANDSPEIQTQATANANKKTRRKRRINVVDPPIAESEPYRNTRARSRSAEPQLTAASAARSPASSRQNMEVERMEVVEEIEQEVVEETPDAADEVRMQLDVPSEEAAPSYSAGPTYEDEEDVEQLLVPQTVSGNSARSTGAQSSAEVLELDSDDQRVRETLLPNVRHSRSSSAQARQRPGEPSSKPTSASFRHKVYVEDADDDYEDYAASLDLISDALIARKDSLPSSRPSSFGGRNITTRLRSGKTQSKDMNPRPISDAQFIPLSGTRASLEKQPKVEVTQEPVRKLRSRHVR
ncbi:hypothetical protein A0H81_04967 [Grifola frondosa]|uniref:Uncharacterized protein n=1 Tax=Grifola frondosa TaxID=5627 RepID=A0A1C7MK12_GRIFR|nr:hypothetical protein A0H81_04967 [Grifola frondosa]